MRDIRNRFAHNADHELSFTDQSIADKCRTLKVAGTLIAANETLAAGPPVLFSSAAIRAMGSIFQGPRERFEITIEMLAQHLEELGPSKPSYDGPDLHKALWVLGTTEPTVQVVGTATAPFPDEASPK